MSDENEETAADNLPYRHPLLVESAARNILSVEVPLESADGRHFAFQDGVVADEDGSEERFSGVIQVASRLMSDSEKSALAGEKKSQVRPPPQSAKTTASKIGSELQTLLTEWPSGDPNNEQEVDVEIAVRRTSSESIVVELERAMLRGEISLWNGQQGAYRI